MAEFAIEGDAIRCLEGDRGTRAPGRIVETPGGVTIAEGPSIEGIGLTDYRADTREALIEQLTGAGHIVLGG